jgi:hypothetical protein
MTLGKNQASALSGTAGTWAQASEERIADNNVEKIPLAAGLIATGKDTSNEAMS